MGEGNWASKIGFNLFYNLKILLFETCVQFAFQHKCNNEQIWHAKNWTIWLIWGEKILLSWISKFMTMHQAIFKVCATNFLIMDICVNPPKYANISCTYDVYWYMYI